MGIHKLDICFSYTLARMGHLLLDSKHQARQLNVLRQDHRINNTPPLDDDDGNILHPLTVLTEHIDWEYLFEEYGHFTIGADQSQDREEQQQTGGAHGMDRSAQTVWVVENGHGGASPLSVVGVARIF